MPAYCVSCNRSFKEQGHLDQHTRTSSAHKKPTQGPPQVQTLLQVNLLPVKPKRQKQPSPYRLPPATHRVRPTEPQQALDFNFRAPRTTSQHKQGQLPDTVASSSRTPRITTQHKHGQPPDTIASSSRTLQITKHASPHDMESRWSVISESEYTAVLNALSAHCHSPRELEENGYLLHPYDPQDYIKSRKCKRCNSKFLILIIRS